VSESGKDHDADARRGAPEPGIPGPGGVCIGGMISSGRPVGPFAYLVYVVEKKPPDQIPFWGETRRQKRAAKWPFPSKQKVAGEHEPNAADCAAYCRL
jgi:hypothetical protein